MHIGDYILGRNTDQCGGRHNRCRRSFVRYAPGMAEQESHAPAGSSGLADAAHNILQPCIHMNTQLNIGCTNTR